MEDTTAVVSRLAPANIKLDLTIPPTQVMEIIKPRFSTTIEVYVGMVVGVKMKQRGDKPALVTDQGTTMQLDRCYRTTPEIADRLLEWTQDFERMMEGAEHDLNVILAEAGSVKIIRGASSVPGAIPGTPSES